MNRPELVLLGAAAVLGLYGLMLRGWRRRQQRQGDLPAPPTATGSATTVVGGVPGLFVGTTFAGRWLDRVAVHGLSVRAAGRLRIATDGVHIEREGAAEVYLPFGMIEDAGPGDALAGKVMGEGGLLVLTWRLGESLLTSAFRADDHAQHARLAEAVLAQRPVAA
jgi:hypothetical protein